MEKIKISIGIPAYNEEKNITKLLARLFSQKTNNIMISEIIVIASGCNDQTVPLVKKFQQNKKGQTPLLHLIIEPERKGKATAINTFLQHAKETICVIESADTLPETNAIENLCLPFNDKKIGLTGGHPIPTNNPSHFVGFCVHMLWSLHHQIALKKAKCGEIIAFRKVFSKIPVETPVDESSIEVEIKKNGFQIAYVPDAIVLNKGPETLAEYRLHRQRINAGHHWLKKHYGYKVSTSDFPLLITALISHLKQKPRSFLWLSFMIFIEIMSKVKAIYDIEIKKKNYAAWQPISTSKDPS